MQVERLHPGWTTGSQLLLQKGRRLTEQTLNSCQLKRLRANSVRSSMDIIAAIWMLARPAQQSDDLGACLCQSVVLQLPGQLLGGCCKPWLGSVVRPQLAEALRAAQCDFDAPLHLGGHLLSG